MSDFYLRKKLTELCKSNSTLLWLEGSRTEHVTHVKLVGERLVLQLANNTSRVVLFERYATTEVGLQFWSKGRPGVLYRWEQVQVGTVMNSSETAWENDHSGDEPPTPPVAA